MTSRLIATKLIDVTEGDYIGRDGQIFWNTDENSLRRSDGVTKGGIPILENGAVTGFTGSQGIQGDIGFTGSQGITPDFIPTQFINFFDFTSNSVTTFESVNQWKKVVTSTTNLFSNGDFEHENNKITNTGGDIVVKMEGIGSIVSSQGSTEIHMAFFKNGQLIPCSEQSAYTVTHGQNSYASAIPFQCIFNLSNGDELEVYVKNTTNSNSITLRHLNVIITRLV
jgi:hypothetical protein